MNRKSLFAVLCLIVLLPCIAWCKDYLVTDEAGFYSALKSVGPGDAIVWKPGSYANIDMSFSPDQKGTEGRPIVLRAQEAGKTIFRGSSKLTIKGEWLIIEGLCFQGPSTLEKGDVIQFSEASRNCRANGCMVKDYSPTNEMANNVWLTLGGTENEVDHCHFEGKTNQGPMMVVRYATGPNYVEGSDAATPGLHRIHHNYFGRRTMPSNNGGEDIRVGDSKTSFTHGLNMIEKNFFEGHRLEPEVISNKSCDNIYRFNTFIDNDGKLVLRHGNGCLVYGNKLDGKNGRGRSGGVRIINPNQTVVNNYIANAEGGKTHDFDAGITLMAGLLNGPLNGYYAADSAIVAYNTIVGSTGPSIKAGVGNKNKGLPFVAPKNVVLAYNMVADCKDGNLMEEKPEVAYAMLKGNLAIGCDVGNVKGFVKLESNALASEKGYLHLKNKSETNDPSLFKAIKDRAARLGVALSDYDITFFDPAWPVKREEAGPAWMR